MKKINFYENKNVISRRVRYFRNLRKISQEQLVARLQVMNINIDQQGISRIENNTRIVTDYELACLCRALGVTVEETGRSREGDMTTVLARQLWEGSPMPDAVVVMTLRGEELESLSFRRMVSTGEAPAAGETITAATALARFLEELNQEGYVCSQVREVYPGYSLSGSTAVTLSPTWYVETDAWPWRFAVDGVTGQVSAADNG